MRAYLLARIVSCAALLLALGALALAVIAEAGAGARVTAALAPAFGQSLLLALAAALVAAVFCAGLAGVAWMLEAAAPKTGRAAPLRGLAIIAATLALGATPVLALAGPAGLPLVIAPAALCLGAYQALMIARALRAALRRAQAAPLAPWAVSGALSGAVSGAGQAVDPRAALRIAALDALRGAGPAFSAMVAAGVMVEAAFTWPGLGALAARAAAAGDAPMLAALGVALAAVLLALDLSLDALSLALDPRRRTPAAPL